MFLVLGLRPGELFALRRDDRVDRCRLRIDESVSDLVEGNIVAPKTEASIAFVWIPESIAASLDEHIEAMDDTRPEAFLFPSRRGTPMAIKNFLRRNLKRAADRAVAKITKTGAKVPDGFLAGVTHQVFRRTCATTLQHIGSVKDIQAHLRHATPIMTAGTYIQEIPASVRAAVESLDVKLLGKG